VAKNGNMAKNGSVARNGNVAKNGKLPKMERGGRIRTVAELLHSEGWRIGDVSASPE
jgi:hypothetical protein